MGGFVGLDGRAGSTVNLPDLGHAVIVAGGFAELCLCSPISVVTLISPPCCVLQFYEDQDFQV